MKATARPATTRSTGTRIQDQSILCGVAAARAVLACSTLAWLKLLLVLTLVISQPLHSQAASGSETVATDHTRVQSPVALQPAAEAPAPGALELSTEERAWLAAHPVIRVGVDRDFAPYEWIDADGRHQGLAADYMRILEGKLGVRFEIVGDRPWAGILAMASRGELDLLACAVRTPEREQYMSFSKPYKSTQAVIIDNGYGEYIGGLERLNGKRVAVERGYFMQELIAREHPKIELVPAGDTSEALNLVVAGRADAYVGDAGTAAYAIRKAGLLSLRFAGQTEYSSRHSVAISRNSPLLASIIAKAMDSIPQTEADALFSRWLGLRIEEGIDPRTLLTYGAAVLGLFLLFSYWLLRLRREIAERRMAEQHQRQHSHVLQMLAEKVPLEQVLETIAADVESVGSGIACRVLTVDAQDGHPVEAGPLAPRAAASGQATDPNSMTTALAGAGGLIEMNASHPWWPDDFQPDHDDGNTSRWLQPIRSGQGRVLGVIAILCRDASPPSGAQLQRIEAETRLAALAIEQAAVDAQLKLAASVFTHAREGIMITDADGTIVEVNDTFSRITGFSREEALGQNPRILKSGRHGPDYYAQMWQALLAHGYWVGETWNRRRNGEVFAEMRTISAVRDVDGKVRNYVALFTDITHMKEHQQQLERIAHYDALTGLPNRVLLADRLNQALAQSHRRGQALAVAYLDLDGFKAINDKYGHHVGDELLILIAQRMRAALREGDTLARIGGDEFVAVLFDLDQADDWQSVLTRLLQAASEPATVADTVLQVSTSIGVTISPNDPADADQLMRHADRAMYEAKQAGKNRYHLFDVDQDTALQSRHENLAHIRLALERGEFVLHYQPKVNMKSGEVTGAEALIRWQHPEQGLLPPAAFLPTVENHPVGVELGEWVIDTALAQMGAWRAAGLDLAVSVNVGARQFQQDDFVPRLARLLAAHPDVDPKHLELEVLETSALDDIAHVSQVMQACQAYGVRFALDDFGTGYSSLTYLKRLPAEMLKIDQSFVRDMLDDPDDLAIIEGVIGLATAFSREVIAEGVETVAHGELLLSLGCELAQGYGIARPMPAHELSSWFANWRPSSAWTAWDGHVPTTDDRSVMFTDVELRRTLRRIEHYLDGSRDQPPDLDPIANRFERWHIAGGRNRYAGEPELIAAIEADRRLHALGRELIAARRTHPDNSNPLERMGELHALHQTLIGHLWNLVGRPVKT